MSAPGGEDLVGAGDHDAADVVVGVEALDLVAQPVHQLGREGVAGLGPVEPAERDAGPSMLVSTQAHVWPRLGVKGRIASTPVASRPMISFWIWEVPS